MIHLLVAVDNTAELLDPAAYGPGALLRWESGPAESGPFAEGGTVALVAGTSAYDVWDPAGVVGTWYRTRISDAAASTFSAYSPARPGDPGSVVTPDQVRALVPTALGDVQLQGVIDREEAYLARLVTDLTGERTQAYLVGSPADRGLGWDPVLAQPGRAYAAVWTVSDRIGPLGLLRPASSVSVVDNGVPVPDGDVRLLRQGTVVERASGGWNGPVVTVTYTPNDLLEVQRVVIELCRLTLTETGYQSERIGDYSYSKHLRPGPGQSDPKRDLVRSLMTHLPKGTMRIRTQSEDDRIGAVTP